MNRGYIYILLLFILFLYLVYLYIPIIVKYYQNKKKDNIDPFYYYEYDNILSDELTNKND
jgi:hypothetical protein